MTGEIAEIAGEFAFLFFMAAWMFGTEIAYANPPLADSGKKRRLTLGGVAAAGTCLALCVLVGDGVYAAVAAIAGLL